MDEQQFEHDRWLQDYPAHYFQGLEEEIKAGNLSRMEAVAKIRKYNVQVLDTFVNGFISEEIKSKHEDPLSKSLLRAKNPKDWEREEIAKIKYNSYETKTKHLSKESDLDGAESIIFYNEVLCEFVKIGDFDKERQSLKKFLYGKVYAHNIIFPETSYEIDGLVNSPTGGKASVVLKQRAVEGVEMDKDDRSAFIEQMEREGFFRLDTWGDEWSIGGVITIGDLHDRNVIKGVDGRFYIIDPIIEWIDLITIMAGIVSRFSKELEETPFGQWMTAYHKNRDTDARIKYVKDHQKNFDIKAAIQCRIKDK
ncbi:MAG: hypothetical protein LBE71_04600 [Dysgonamonadaceae bacterium]|jgi:hypothetical protein|nr:hypothetical protein [Dysgonamonadaceae bacterium]